MHLSAIHVRCLRDQAAPHLRARSDEVGVALRRVATLGTDGPHIIAVADGLADEVGLRLTRQGCAYDPKVPHEFEAEYPDRLILRLGDHTTGYLTLVLTVTTMLGTTRVGVEVRDGDVGVDFTVLDAFDAALHDTLVWATPGERRHAGTWREVLLAVATDIVAGYELPDRYWTHPDA